MKFAIILREAGFSISEFLKISEIPIVLYDGKNRIISDEEIHFSEKIFSKNLSSYDHFSAFLSELEKGPTISSMGIKIDESSLIIFYQSPKCRIFLR